MFKEVADIQTADMLNLPTPEAHYEVIKTLPSEEQKEILKSLSERADDVRNRVVEPDEDNMLKITNDGKKLALDQRLINPLLPDNPDSKVNVCVKKCVCHLGIRQKKIGPHSYYFPICPHQRVMIVLTFMMILEINL